MGPGGAAGIAHASRRTMEPGSMEPKGKVRYVVVLWLPKRGFLWA